MWRKRWSQVQALPCPICDFGQVTHSHVFWCPLSTVSVFPNPGFFVNNENVWHWTLQMQVTPIVIIAPGGQYWVTDSRKSPGSERNRFCTGCWRDLCSGPGLPLLFYCLMLLWPLAPPSHSSKIWIFLSSTDHPDYLCEQPVTSRFGQKRMWQFTPTPPHSILRYNTGTHACTHIPFYPHAFC